MFIGLGCFPLTGYNPGLLLASVLNITPLHNGVDSTVPHVGGVEQKRKPQLTFCVSEALAILRRTYLGSFFLDPEDFRSLHLGQFVTLLKEQGCHDLVISLRCKNGLIKRPTCIRTGRASTRLLF
jgi:hypothetical protein